MFVRYAIYNKLKTNRTHPKYSCCQRFSHFTLSPRRKRRKQQLEIIKIHLVSLVGLQSRIVLFRNLFLLTKDFFSNYPQKILHNQQKNQKQNLKYRPKQFFQPGVLVASCTHQPLHFLWYFFRCCPQVLAPL